MKLLQILITYPTILKKAISGQHWKLLQGARLKKLTQPQFDNIDFFILLGNMHNLTKNKHHNQNDIH